MRRGVQLLLAGLLATLTIQAQAAETRREDFGDWGFICTKPDNPEAGEGGAEQVRESCNLFQTALLNNEQAEGGQRVLLTRVGYLEGSEEPVLLVTAPLGILLPLAITIEVAGHETISIPVQRCDGGGCLAYVVMEAPFIEAFSKAAEARVTFYDMQRRGITIPLSLKGFTKGMEELVESRGN